MYELIKIGFFLNDTGTFIATDPCYLSGSVEDNSIIKKATKGIWYAWRVESDEDDWGVRNAALLVAHSSFRMAHAFKVRNPSIWKPLVEDDYRVVLPLSKWTNLDAGTGVDSGQAGFYNGGSSTAEDSGWYEKVCDGSDNGIITKEPTGVTTSSGLGDGYYGVWGARREGQFVALCLDFGLGWMAERLEHELIQSCDPRELPALLPHVSNRNRDGLTERIKNS